MGLPSYDKGVGGDTYEPNAYTELANAIGTVALQLIRENTADDKFAIFNKTPVDTGDTIEQIVGKLLASSPYDSTGANTLDRDTSSKVMVKLFKDWDARTFKTTVDISMIRKIMMRGGDGAETVASMLVSQLNESDKYDKYTNGKGLLTWARTSPNNAIVHATDVSIPSGGTRDPEAILKNIKNIVSGMQYVNDDFNIAGYDRRTRPEDIYIVMPYELKNDLDVDVLAGVFNLSKDELGARIIEIDSSDKFVYVVDQNAILMNTRLYEMLPQLNAKGHFYNYYLHCERLYGISPLFDACYFEYDKA